MSLEINVPYITDDGFPIHVISADEQRGYFSGLTVEQGHTIVSHSKRVWLKVKELTSSRADMRKQSRELLRLPSGATPADKAARIVELEELRDKYAATEVTVTRLKSIVYTTDTKGQLTLPPIE